jgi:hypothetical protein
MIKTPVSYDDSDNVFYPYPQVEDANGSFIFECNDKRVAQEIVKRINMHDELVKRVQQLSALSDADMASAAEWIESHVSEIDDLLEKCK